MQTLIVPYRHMYSLCVFVLDGVADTGGHVLELDLIDH